MNISQYKYESGQLKARHKVLDKDSIMAPAMQSMSFAFADIARMVVGCWNLGGAALNDNHLLYAWGHPTLGFFLFWRAASKSFRYRALDIP